MICYYLIAPDSTFYLCICGNTVIRLKETGIKTNQKFNLVGQLNFN
jgi:hypothetical protein